jgi:serine/threonine protein kinase
MFGNSYHRRDSGTLEKYQLYERIGQGSYGTVHRAINRETGLVVALKQPRLNHGDIFKRFRNEIDFYSRMRDSPFVVKMLDFSLDPYGAFVAIEFCNKGTVRDRLWELQINRLRTIALLWQTASALTDLHHRGILHRDIKPENLLLMVEANNDWIIKIGDPGLVCFPATSVFDFGATRTPKGTEFYIAPELYRQFAVYDASCDIFSLGVAAHEMLSGRRVSAGSKITGQGEKLDNLLARMISLNPSERPSASGIQKELADIYDEELAAAKNRKEIGLLVGIVLAVIGIGHLLAKGK